MAAQFSEQELADLRSRAEQAILGIARQRFPGRMLTVKWDEADTLVEVSTGPFRTPPRATRSECTRASSWPNGARSELGVCDRDALCSTTGANDGRPDREPDQRTLLADRQ
jgi:hypothetical protein